MEKSTENQVRHLGSRLEPFVDEWLIETMSGVGLKMHAPIPREIALHLDRPWEGSYSYDPVVEKEDGRFRLWYRGCGPVWDDQCTAYAESEDGIHWQRPDLGLFEFEGSRHNNIVLQGHQAKALCVFKDLNLAAPEAESYKAIGIGPPAEKRATLRKDGFCSMHATYSGGEFTTRPLVFAGRQLFLNYSTSAVGSLRVEVQDETGRSLSGYELSASSEIFGDEIERPVAWQNNTDISSLAGRPFRLRFVLRDADLYSIQFR